MAYEKVKLGELAEVLSGCVLSRREAHDAADAVCTYRVLTLRHFAQCDVLDAADSENETKQFKQTFPTVAESSTKESVLAHRGDVIVRLNYPHGARLVTEKSEGLLIPSACAIVRTCPDLDPAFLAYFLNAPTTLKKSVFQKNPFGLLARPVTIGELKNLELPKLPLDEQNKIATLWAAVQEEQRLLKSLTEKKLELAHLKIQERMEKGMVK